MSKDRTLTRARYTSVERRMWNDGRFRALSPMLPCGQGLWIHLLTTPRLGVLPGLIVMGEAAMAEDLGWELDAFRAAFAEIATQDMARADWKARLIVMTKAIERNKPESPNVVRSWRGQWLEVPDCELKAEYFDALRAVVESMGPGFAAALVETFPEEMAKASRKDPPKLRGSVSESFAEAFPDPSRNQNQNQIQNQIAVLDPPPKTLTREAEPSPVEPKPAAAAAATSSSEPRQVEQAIPPILAELEKHKPFEALADLHEIAHVLANRHISNAIDRGTKIAWTLTAIGECAADCAGQGLSGREITKMLRSYVDHARAPRKPAPERAETEPLERRIPDGVPDLGPARPMEEVKASAERSMARFQELVSQAAQEPSGRPVRRPGYSRPEQATGSVH